MNTTSIFIPFEKKNEEERTVSGYASTEALDVQGEVVEKEAIARALPEYMRFANIREMHTTSAVGKAKAANLDDRGLFIKVKVVDDTAWNKVKEGVYNGFSIGGRTVTKIGNRIKDLVLSEISLVDRPANPEALFTVVKFDNTKESMKKYSDMVEIDVEDAEERKQREEKMQRVSEFVNGQVSIMEVSQVIELAKYLMGMIVDRLYAGKTTDDLETALQKLKDACVSIMGEADAKQMATKMDEIVSLAKQMNSMGMEKFAYIAPNGSKHLPIETDEMLTHSLNNFSKTAFAHNDFRILAARLLKAYAEKRNIRVTNTFLNRAATEPMSGETMLQFAKYDSVYTKSRDIPETK